MRAAGLLAGVLFALAPSWALGAQWGLSAEIGVARFGGTGRDSSGARVGPYRPTTFAVRAERTLGSSRVSLAVMYARTGIAGEQGDVAVVFYDAASLVEFAPELSIRLARFGAGLAARVEGGPAVDVWEIEGVSRTRVGARGGIALEWPLGGRFTGSLRATGVVSPSVINTGETPGGVERSSTRRGGVSIGVGYRL